MAHPLDGSRVRIHRAGDHLEALDATLTRFAKEGSYQIAGEKDAETDEYVMRIYSERQPPVPPPLIASAMAGDALNSLRSGLDYLVWQLAESPSRDNQFPLYDSVEKWEQWHRRRLSTVPERLWLKFERFQPYPDRQNNFALKVLTTLNDADKHRLLLPASVSHAGRKGKFTVSGLDSISIKGRDWVPFEDGAEIYRMRLAPHPESKVVAVNAEVPYTIALADPETNLWVTIADLRRLVISVSNVVESFAGDF
jgi:hypothetical protein